MRKPTRILVPTDFSGYSDEERHQTLDIARKYHAKVYLVHGNICGVRLNFTISGEVKEKIRHDISGWVNKGFEHQLSRFPQSREVEVITNVRQGIPCEEILKEEKGIDLIVIASLGRTGMAKYLVGSVARNVLKGSPHAAEEYTLLHILHSLC